MPEKKNVVSVLPDNAIADIAGKFYNDAIHPAALQLGFIGEGIMKLVALPFKFLGYTADELEEKYKIFIHKSIIKVPAEKMVEPSPVVIGPLLEHVKYVFNDDILVNMFSNLLAAAINIDTIDEIHPSFVYNICRMSSLDAQFLTFLYQNIIFKSDLSVLTKPLHQTHSSIVLANYSSRIQCTEFQSNVSFKFLESIGLVNIKKCRMFTKDVYFSVLKITKTYPKPEIKKFKSKFLNSATNLKYSSSKRRRKVFKAYFPLPEFLILEFGKEADQFLFEVESNGCTITNCDISRSIITLTDYGKLFSKHCCMEGIYESL